LTPACYIENRLRRFSADKDSWSVKTGFDQSTRIAFNLPTASDAAV
jgi:hypothetical protein